MSTESLEPEPSERPLPSGQGIFVTLDQEIEARVHEEEAILEAAAHLLTALETEFYDLGGIQECEPTDKGLWITSRFHRDQPTVSINTFWRLRAEYNNAASLFEIAESEHIRAEKLHIINENHRLS